MPLWISPKIREKMSHRDRLKLESTDSGDIHKFEVYKKLRNSIKKDLEFCKTEYYKNKFHSPDNSVGSTWDAVNDYIGSSKKSRGNSPSMLINNHCLVISQSLSFYLAQCSDI